MYCNMCYWLIAVFYCVIGLMLVLLCIMYAWLKCFCRFGARLPACVLSMVHMCFIVVSPCYCMYAAISAC